ncbi:hypothetical protein [Mucilaginibacter ginsenosidivorans]|nr:hypothetical protein [Mucilaginibacter ginsenosidivorans]
MRPILIILLFMLIAVSAKSQKWQKGSFTDIKGNKVTGLIHDDLSGKGPIKDEGYIEFKDDSKANPYKLSASDLKSYMVGQDSFVVAHAPHNTTWTKKELDFVKVELDEETKLYVAEVGTVSGGGNGIGVRPAGGVGFGTGPYGGGYGGVSIDIGGGRGRKGPVQATYYYGANTAEMDQLTPMNFEDAMSDIMGDEQEVVDKIRAHQFNLGNIQKLIAYFKQVKEAESKRLKAESNPN